MKNNKKLILFLLILTVITVSLVVTTLANEGKDAKDGFVVESTSISTKQAADITAAVKSSHPNNALTSIGPSNNIATGHTADILNTYVVTNVKASNKYLALHNNNSPTGVYLDMFINKLVTYNSSVEQYIVYDFDMARLGDTHASAAVSSITRSSDNKTAYFCSGYYLSTYTNSFPLDTMTHVTVIYDFNSNKSYLYANNTLLGSLDNGVMSAQGHSLWKSGATMNHNSVRLMNPLINQAIDNVTARYITNDASLKGALGSSLSSWSGAIYNESYVFPEVCAIATFNGENIYFEEVLAEKLATAVEDDSFCDVEILRPFDTALLVNRNATIETNGLKCSINIGNNAIQTANGTTITVKTAGLSATTTVSIPSIYQSGMVFQRGEPITVRGYCKSEGSEIKVTLGDITLTAVTDKNGEWEATFESMEAVKGLTLTVEQLGTLDGVAPLSYTNIDVGDVFLLSGQSNMDYNVQYMEDYEELKANADNYHNLRGYLSDNTYRHGEDGYGKGTWYTLTSETIGCFPATGYAMLTKLAAAIDEDVTIAIVEASFPGSIIKTWIDADVYYEKYGKDTNYTTYEKYLAFYKQNGRCPTSSSELTGWIGKSYQQVLASCFDSIIAPLEGYRVKAVVWDQGSGDLGRINEYADHYALLQDSFNATLRTENVPFIMHNLVPRALTQYKNFLVEQYNIAANDPYTYLVSMGYEGAVYNSYEWSQNPDLSYVFVHTSRKSPIGIRTANVILENLYGIDADSTPMITSVKLVGASVVVTATEDLTVAYGSAPFTFEIAGADGVYHSAIAEINGNTITLTSDEVQNPTKIRYAYSDFVIEMQDGTLVEIKSGYTNCVQTQDSLTVTDVDGKVYVINKDQYDSIRSYCTGNIASEAGSPLPTFELEVGYEAN